VPDARLWSSRLTLYAAPARNEGCRLTPLHAPAAPPAVVASAAGAYAEMIVEGTGTSVAAGDGAALRRAIEPYLADPALAEREGENALRHVRATFPLEKEALAIIGVYERLFAGK